MRRRGHRLRPALLAAALLAGGCGDAEPTAEHEREAPAPEQPAEATQTEGVTSLVDAFGNLRGTGEHILGFELPRGAERRAEGPLGQVVYAPATEERLVRFYRSRGHQIIRTLSGWRIEHTERTLRAQEGAPRAASVRLDRGPGPGWTLRFDDGEPVELSQPPLIELIEAERRQAGFDDGPGAADPSVDANEDEHAIIHGADLDAPAPQADGRTAPDDASIRRLRERALEREVDTRRARDVSDRIYEYAKEHPERGFLD